VSRRQRCPSQSRERGHKDELRKRQDFADHAVGPEHQSGSKRDEVSSHMGREQTLQPKETRRIEEPSIESQEMQRGRNGVSISPELVNSRFVYFLYRCPGV
jgi:hypothetical protein